MTQTATVCTTPTADTSHDGPESMAQRKPQRRIILSISPATATHCGSGDDRCPGAGIEKCYFFNRWLGGDPDRPERLPACIAAELP